VGIDTGGTFTDCVYLREGRLHVLKVLATPDDPGRAVVEALRQIGATAPLAVRHGTTVGTNAMLERKGARVAFVTTAGFEDTIAIGRQARPRLYDWFQPAPACLVPPELRFGIRERVTAEGHCLIDIEPKELRALVETVRSSGAESIAISLLFSFANPEHEIAVASALRELGLPVSVSHRILPEFREYERASTIVANAYLAPTIGSYLDKLARSLDAEFGETSLTVMQSSGGIISARVAAKEPVRTVLSGPAGGVVAAHKLGQLAGFPRIIGFDMGGTSTDVCLVDASAGGLQIGNESTVSGVPIAISMLNIHTVGAGGGSIARFDAGGMLRVGPESAGSTPGPICFGRGELPTVTDANLILGRLDSASFLGGAVPLDVERTRAYMARVKNSLGSVEEFAAGILEVVQASMTKAMRVISIEKGYDPRDFALVAFGGGGPLHACHLARELEVPRVVVPPLPGAFSAVGILLADTVREYSRTVMLPIDAPIDAIFAELEERGSQDFRSEGLEGSAFRSADLRYKGQGYELNVPFGVGMAAAFHALHFARYGFANEQRAIEVVNVRVRMVSAAAPFEPQREALREGDGRQALKATRQVWFHSGFQPARIYDRDCLVPGDTVAGPAIVSEYSSATVVPPGDLLRVDALRNLVIEVHG
jgi:N-methylhydantoinase A